MPVKPPAVPEPLKPSDFTVEVQTRLASGDGVANCLFERDALEPMAETAHFPITLEFSRCCFRLVTFHPSSVECLHFTDCLFEKCDLSGLRLTGGVFRRVRFDGCRCMGLSLERADLRDVSFADCVLNYLSLTACKLRDVAFSRCQMENAMLYACRQEGLILDTCGMTCAEIVETKLAGVDLSNCEIGGLRASIQCLEGAQASLMQAPTLLSLCGIRIKL